MCKPVNVGDGFSSFGSAGNFERYILMSWNDFFIVDGSALNGGTVAGTAAGTIPGTTGATTGCTTDCWVNSMKEKIISKYYGIAQALIE